MQRISHRRSFRSRVSHDRKLPISLWDCQGPSTCLASVQPEHDILVLIFQPCTPITLFRLCTCLSIFSASLALATDRPYRLIRPASNLHSSICLIVTIECEKILQCHSSVLIYVPHTLRSWTLSAPTYVRCCRGSGGSLTLTVYVSTAFLTVSSVVCSGATVKACGTVSAARGKGHFIIQKQSKSLHKQDDCTLTEF